MFSHHILLLIQAHISHFSLPCYDSGFPYPDGFKNTYYNHHISCGKPLVAFLGALDNVDPDVCLLSPIFSHLLTFCFKQHATSGGVGPPGVHDQHASSSVCFLSHILFPPPTNFDLLISSSRAHQGPSRPLIEKKNYLHQSVICGRQATVHCSSRPLQRHQRINRRIPYTPIPCW